MMKSNRFISEENSAMRTLVSLFCAVYPQSKAEAYAEKLLRAYGSLTRILKISPELLSEQIGKEAALYLRVCVSLYLRRTTDALKPGTPVTEDALVRHFDALYRDCGQETVYLLLTDEKERLLSRKLLSVGAADTSGVSPRQILEHALREGAAGVYLVHNHPGGDLTPSLSDERATRAVSLALSAADIRFFGHYIFSDGSFVRVQPHGTQAAQILKEIR